MEKSQELRRNRTRLRPFGYFKKIFCIVACLILVFSLFTIPAFAADSSVSSFLFYADDDVYMEPGYDYYVINQYSGSYYLSYHTADEIANYTITSHNSTYLKVNMSRKLWYYMFDSMADLLSFLRFNSETCNASSLATRKESANEYFYVQRTGVIMTNCPSLKVKFSDAGYAVDGSYYAYFNNVDAKHYVLCFVTVSNSEYPLAIFVNSIPQYNSSTQVLSSTTPMYIFRADTVEGCLKFFKDEDGSDLLEIAKGTELNNVTSFVASSCDIIDLYTGQVFFHAKDFDGKEIGNLTINNLNSEDLHASTALSVDMIDSLLAFGDNILASIAAIPHLFDWLPSGFAVAINSILITFGILLVALIALKIIHG